MGISALDHIVRQYFARSLAPTTLSSYRSAANCYLAFCSQFNLHPLPLSQSSVVSFVVYLAETGVSYASLRTYLSGIRFLQISNGLADPCLSAYPMLEYVIRGIRRSPKTPSRPPRLPITPDILQLLFASWSRTPRDDNYDTTMLWAACCVGFFGFMRAGEFTCSSLQAFDHSKLCPQDIAVDSHHNPTMVTIHLRHSKTDPFGAGLTIYLGRTGHPICPVSALLSYMSLRGQHPGPLFLFRDGSCLSKQRLLSRINKALASQGVDSAHITGHSFRIGAATTAARLGLEDSLIQTLGRWRSSAFLRYLRTPGQVLASTSARLLDPHPLSGQH